MKHICKLKFVFLLLCIILLLGTLTSCYHRYDGDRLDLYTVVINNVWAINGSTSNGEISYDPEISVIEVDDYGRTLFFYNEGYGKGDRFSMAFVIMQKADDEYVYYYRDDCYSFFFDDPNYFWHGRGNGENYLKALETSGDLIEKLKAQNDWNKEFDESKCTKAKISHKFPKGKNVYGAFEFDEAVYAYAKANGYEGSDNDAVRSFQFCQVDSTGKELYYVYSTTSDEVDGGQTIYGYHAYAVIVDYDRTENVRSAIITKESVVEITDSATANELIDQLKEQNGWQ